MYSFVARTGRPMADGGGNCRRSRERRRAGPRAGGDARSAAHHVFCSGGRTSPATYRLRTLTDVRTWRTAGFGSTLPATDTHGVPGRCWPPRRPLANLPLADGHRVASGVSVCSDGRHAVFQSTPGYSVWRVGLDRIEAVRLTSGHIDSYPVCSADGQSVLYSSVRPSFPSIWRVAIDGGEPAQLIPQRALEALPSPTGRLIYHFGVEGDGQSAGSSQFKWIVVSLADGRRVFSRDAPVTARLGVSPVWAPDETGLDYVLTRDSVSNPAEADRKIGLTTPAAALRSQPGTGTSSDRLRGPCWCRHRRHRPRRAACL